MTENIKLIPLSQGLHAVVDAADYDALSQFKWCAVRNKSTVYAERMVTEDGKRRKIKMHRAIMDPDSGVIVDHVNHDGLDNRRTNLRVCTQSENKRNAASRRGSSSRYLGVSRLKRGTRWDAQIVVAGQKFHLGRYVDEAEAARAYDIAAREHFGQFANPNFPLDRVDA